MACKATATAKVDVKVFLCYRYWNKKFPMNSYSHVMYEANRTKEFFISSSVSMKKFFLSGWWWGEGDEGIEGIGWGVKRGHPSICWCEKHFRQYVNDQLNELLMMLCGDWVAQPPTRSKCFIVVFDNFLRCLTKVKCFTIFTVPLLAQRFCSKLAAIKASH